MTKHRDECCFDPMMMYGYGQYGMAGFGGGGCGGNYGGWNIRWIYAFLILIVVVLQFARRPERGVVASPCGEDGVVAARGFVGEEGTIDRSVLFIIVVFLLILCSGCWTGGCNNYGSVGGYGYY